MGRLTAPLIFLITIFPCLPLPGDILITNDDMVLNGKIIEDKKPVYVIFANNHGTFTIEYTQIKEIHKTESVEGDKKIYNDMGKKVNEEELLANYRAGQDKLADHQKNFPVALPHTDFFMLMFDFFYNLNLGKLHATLPSSLGGTVTGKIPVEQLHRIPALWGIDSHVTYFNSEKNNKSIRSIVVSAGPLWRLPVAISDYHFFIDMSATSGMGYYWVKGETEKMSALKWHISLCAGPAFKFFSIILSLQGKFDYIYDTSAPLSALGLSAGIGYQF